MTAGQGIGRFHRLAVAEIRRETPDAVSIVLAVPERLRRVYRFAPGQYLTLRAIFDGEEIRRCYSICSGLDDGELRIAVKLVPGGVYSTFVNQRLATGDVVEAMTPMGQFTTALDPEATRLFVGLACGSGITPVMSLLKSVLSREKRSRFFLIYGNRASRDIMFAEALGRLKDRYLDRLSLTHVLSREARESPVLHGRLDRDRIRRLLRAVLPTGAIDHAFVCGPAAMMDEAAFALAARDLAPERIHREFFTPGSGGRSGPPRVVSPPEPESAPAAIAAIIIDGRRHEVPVRPGESIIAAALASGLDPPYSCRAGMCCSCRARLVDGNAEMAVNYSLQPWEIAAGFILTCQARPLTPRLTLDYDAA